MGKNVIQTKWLKKSNGISFPSVFYWFKKWAYSYRLCWTQWTLKEVVTPENTNFRGILKIVFDDQRVKLQKTADIWMKMCPWKRYCPNGYRFCSQFKWRTTSHRSMFWLFYGRLISKSGDLDWSPRSPNLKQSDFYLFKFCYQQVKDSSRT